MGIVSGWVGTISEDTSGLTAASNTAGGSYSQGLRGLYPSLADVLVQNNFITIIQALFTTYSV